MEALAGAAAATAHGVLGHAADLCCMAVGGIVAYIVTDHYVPHVARTLYERNLFGFDINKTTALQRQAWAKKRPRGIANMNGSDAVALKKRAIPESLGILAGAVYLSVVMVLVLLLGVDVSLISGLLTTVTVMLLLGFVDDVLDVRWRYKIFLSAVGTVPLVMAYDGSVSVLIPPTITRYAANYLASSPASHIAKAVGILRDDLQCLHTVGSGMLLSLGVFYKVYLAMLCIFCINSINILAGVNGVEVGQSVVIAVACVVYNLFQLRLETILEVAEQSRAGMSADHQLRAILLLTPFLGVSMALWKYNKYPARIFVGDSYTYFAGTVLAVSGITGVYSKTLLLFFTPQLFNFLISLPQLLGIVFCPRHRVPTWVPASDTLTSSGNLTLLNVILVVCGDMNEKLLTWTVVVVQCLSCAVGFLCRYWIVLWMYEEVH